MTNEGEVRKGGTEFSPDELPGFECKTLALPSEGDGELAATLIRPTRTEPEHTEEDDRPAVLYIHGFIDYFFQTHLAEALEEAGFCFYALDLRRYGRSLRPQNRAATAHEIDDYFEEIDWALSEITARHKRVAGLIGHSTGGLVCALYLASRRDRKVVERLVLNSPFLQFNLAPKDLLLSRLVATCARFFPHVKLPQTVRTTYGETLHISGRGEWNYSLEKKPKAGFSLYSGWFRMIHHAHAQALQGLDLRLPVLCLHSDASHRPGEEPQPRDFSADIVLDVEHIKKRAPLLGPHVTLREISGAVHDVMLSKPAVRAEALSALIHFLKA